MCDQEGARAHTHTRALTLEQGDHVRLSRYHATEFLLFSLFFLWACALANDKGITQNTYKVGGDGWGNHSLVLPVFLSPASSVVGRLH